MLIKDTPQQERFNFWQAQEFALERDIAWAREQLDRDYFVETIAGSKGDLEAQLGVPMDANVFEAKLRPLLPSKTFILHNPDGIRRGVIYEEETGPRCLVSYKSGLMPEFSQMRVVEDIVDTGIKKFSARDMPEMIKLPDPTSPTGWRFAPKDPNAILPGFEKRNKIWHEETRGWRTVLVKLVIEGALTREQVEKNFGRAQTAEWKGHLGHGERTTKW